MEENLKEGKMELFYTFLIYTILFFFPFDVVVCVYFMYCSNNNQNIIKQHNKKENISIKDFKWNTIFYSFLV